MLRTKHPTVSLVIPAYNEEERLAECLAAIARQTVMPLEVIVVDNNSTDNTVAIAQSYPFVRLLKEKRQGIVHARNKGFDAAKGAIIGRIDADVSLPSDWVEHVQRFYTNKEHETAVWSGSGYFYNVRLPRLASFGYELLAFRFNRLLTGHYTVWGSNMALTARQWQQVRRSLCEESGIHEDLDLAIHLNQLGNKVVYDTAIKTHAELRRVQTDRRELWGYLQWWPRTLRLHGRKTWVICWVVGALFLYLASFAWLFLDKIAFLFESRAPKPQTAPLKD